MECGVWRVELKVRGDSWLVWRRENGDCVLRRFSGDLRGFSEGWGICRAERKIPPEAAGGRRMGIGIEIAELRAEDGDRVANLVLLLVLS